MSFDDIVKLIIEKTSLSREEVLKQIREKYEELSGLITEEGAAYIVARNLGINLPSVVRGLQMKNIVPGLRNVNTIGRVFKISPIIEFDRQTGERGKVVNLFIGDDTGYIKLPLWNEQVSIVSDGRIELGDVVQIVNGLAREGLFGDIELSLGKYGSIRKLDDEFNLPSVEELNEKFFGNQVQTINISNLTPGKWKVKAMIVQVFRGKYLFNICPECGLTINGDRCSLHGEVKPSKELVFTAIIDDGTGTIRATFFRKVAEKLLGISADEMAKLEEEERYKLAKKTLGRELIITGVVRNNTKFDRLEFFVNDFNDLDVLAETQKLLELLEK